MMSQVLFTLEEVIFGGAVAAVLLAISAYVLFRLWRTGTGISAIVLNGRDALILLSMVFVAFAFSVESFRHTAALGNGEWFFARNIPGQICYIICALLFVRLISERAYFSETFTSPLKASLTGIGYAVFIPAVFAASLFWLEFAQYFLAIDLQKQESIDIFSSIKSPCAFVSAALCVCVLAPVSEELVFRGVFYRSLKWVINPAVAAIITSFLFALIHGNMFAFPALFLFSILLTLAYEKSGNICSPIVLHALFNIVNVGAIVVESDIYEVLFKNV